MEKLEKIIGFRGLMSNSDKFRLDFLQEKVSRQNSKIDEIVDWINKQEKSKTIPCYLSEKETMKANLKSNCNYDLLSDLMRYCWKEKPPEKKCENCNMYNMGKYNNGVAYCHYVHNITRDCLTNNYKHFESK